jgi:3-phenylpropionate/trans-cinnamate dioxygenase ferredoxin subunit
MNYITIGQTTDVRDGNKRKVMVNGKEILLTSVNNSYYAIDNTCPHMGGSLYEGQLNGSLITCPKHGSIYDVTNGRIIKTGKLFFMKVKTSDIKSYPIKVEGTDIIIGIE